PLARVTASNSLDERSAPIKPTPRRPKSPTVPPQANIFRGAPVDSCVALCVWRNDGSEYYNQNKFNAGIHKIF
ncbi:MAG: hypothetical protein ACR2KT_09750, partial [Methylocella sp.]